MEEEEEENDWYNDDANVSRRSMKRREGERKRMIL
jgi:hypothetical protein